MINKAENEIAKIGVRLLDDAYTAWRLAEAETEAALRSWLDGSSRNRDNAWYGYRAALDREEAAARDLERVSRLARPCVDQLSASAGPGSE